jgi:hypothetical protein
MVPCSKIKVLSLFLLIVFLFVPIAGAASNEVNITEAETYKAPENPGTENDLFAELSAKASLYNDNYDKVPMLLRNFVGSQEIAGKIELENGQMLNVTLLMNGGKIENFYKYDTPTDPNSKFGPSITFETDEQTVRKVLNSKEPMREAVKSMDDGSLKVEVKGLFRKTALWVLKSYYS